MGICIHCLQPKPIAASKCPHCLEHTGIIESTGWTVFHSLVKWIVIIVGISMLYQCAAGAAEIPDPMEQQQ